MEDDDPSALVHALDPSPRTRRVEVAQVPGWTREALDQSLRADVQPNFNANVDAINQMRQGLDAQRSYSHGECAAS